MHQFTSNAGRLKQMTIDISTQEEKERAVNVELSPYAVDKAGEIVSLVYLDKSIIFTR
jgi:hypothetical protein